MHSSIEVSTDVKERSLIYSLLKVHPDVKTGSLKDSLLELGSLIIDNFQNLPSKPKDNDPQEQKAFFNEIDSIQKLLTEIFVFIKETIELTKHPDTYEKCTQNQKEALENLFHAFKILSICIVHRLDVSKIIPHATAAGFLMICEECHSVEFKIKNPQDITQFKKIENGRILDNELKGIVTYTGISGTEVQIKFIDQKHISITREDTTDAEIISDYQDKLETAYCLSTAYKNISVYEKKYKSTYNFSSEKNISKPELNKNVTNQINLLVSNIELYVEKYPRNIKKQAFLMSIKEAKYNLAMRIACDCDDGRAYLLNLLLDCSKTGAIELNLNAAGLNGKTALHWAAESVSKYGALECLKSLLIYAPLNTGGIDLTIKDITQKTYADYLSHQDKEAVDDILSEQFNAIITEIFVNTVTKYIKQNPKLQPFLDAITKKDKDYNQAMRHACALGETHLLGLLFEYSKKTGNTLDFNSKSTNGKTAFHWAATSASKNNNLDCLKLLADYALLDWGCIEFIKDKENKTFEDYLNQELKMKFDIYLDTKYTSGLTVGEPQQIVDFSTLSSFSL